MLVIAALEAAAAAACHGCRKHALIRINVASNYSNLHKTNNEKSFSVVFAVVIFFDSLSAVSGT